jgi:3-oxoadipate enol-lactonase
MPFTESHGTRIYWEESGPASEPASNDTEPLLLIMGLGYAHQMWHRTRPIVSTRYRTIVFDNRGVGKSDVPAGPYPIPQMAADAAAVLDAAGVKRARVFGISMGGMIAQEFALQYPDRVERLILGCTACGGKESVAASKEVRDILMARATMTPEEGALAMVPHIYDASTPRDRVEEDLAIRRTVYPTAQGYLSQIQGIVAWSCFDRLPSIRAKTLVIHGESDELVPPENGRIIANQIPGAELVMLPHASHIFTTDRPQESHAEILRFLEA